MDEPTKEYPFKCDHCDQEVFVHADPDDELEEIWPGPYCEECGHFKSFRLTADTRLKLFWVETADHSEDWFVVMRDRFEAEVSFEGAEGYGDGDATAQFIRMLPEDAGDDDYYPTFETLEACGGKIINRAEPRVVEFDGVQYSEGVLQHTINKLEDDRAELAGRDRRHGTKRDDHIH